MPIDVTKGDDTESEVRRLRGLLEAAEAHQECRFALVTVGLSAVFITTSDSEISEYQRTLMAVFAKHAFNLGAAYHAGIARGISLAQEGKPREEWPRAVAELHEHHASEVASRIMTAAELTRIAMAPFGLEAYVDGDVVLWCKREDADPEAGPA